MVVVVGRVVACWVLVVLFFVFDSGLLGVFERECCFVHVWFVDHDDGLAGDVAGVGGEHGGRERDCDGVDAAGADGLGDDLGFELRRCFGEDYPVGVVWVVGVVVVGCVCPLVFVCVVHGGSVGWF